MSGHVDGLDIKFALVAGGRAEIGKNCWVKGS